MSENICFYDSTKKKQLTIKKKSYHTRLYSVFINKIATCLNYYLTNSWHSFQQFLRNNKDLPKNYSSTEKKTSILFFRYSILIL